MEGRDRIRNSLQSSETLDPLIEEVFANWNKILSAEI